MLVLPALVPLHPFPLYSFIQTMESNQFTDLRGGAFRRDKQSKIWVCSCLWMVSLCSENDVNGQGRCSCLSPDLQGTNRHPLEFNLSPPIREVEFFYSCISLQKQLFCGFAFNRKKKKNLGNHFWMAYTNLGFFFHLPKLRTVTHTYWETNMD